MTVWRRDGCWWNVVVRLFFVTLTDPMDIGPPPSLAWIVIVIVVFVIFVAITVDYVTLWGVRNVFMDLQDSMTITCQEFGQFRYYGTPPTDFGTFTKNTFAWQLSACFGTTLLNCDSNDNTYYEPPGATDFAFVQTQFPTTPNDCYWVMTYQQQGLSYVVFSATFWRWQWYRDMDFEEQAPSPLFNKKVKVHKGFLGMYDLLRPQLLTLLEQLPKQQPVTILGHSLGAALATLCFADVHQNKLLQQPFQGVFAASPRVGNPEFSSEFDKIDRPWWRVTNDSDMVTQVPFPVMSKKIVYEHVGASVSPHVKWFNTNLGSLGKNHTVAYMMFAGVEGAKEKDL